MPLTNLNALRAARVETDPYDYLVVPAFLDTPSLALVNDDYPAIYSAANHTLENLAYGATFKQLMQELQGSEFASVLGKHFDMDLVSLPTTVTVRKFCERTDGNIHTDHKSKVITVLVYFNEKWDNDAGQLRLLRSKDDIEDYAAQITPSGGSLLAFRRTDHSWHGHTQFIGERRMVQLNYLDRGRFAGVSQRVSRFGTHFMKNVLGMR
ncbi:MAG: 2OG-Fe(II) oxygenase [Halioglobus sp.]|nr:2OG-Fe(II) oxygenase [Halioglobus sp.]